MATRLSARVPRPPFAFPPYPPYQRSSSLISPAPTATTHISPPQASPSARSTLESTFTSRLVPLPLESEPQVFSRAIQSLHGTLILSFNPARPSLPTRPSSASTSPPTLGSNPGDRSPITHPNLRPTPTMTIAQEHFGFSPPNSSPESTHDMGSMLYDEDSKDGLFDDEKPRKSAGRKGPGPVAADKRATHNAIERARRESLNGRFMTLAEALPSMANVKRPSKSIIVNKALDFVFDAQVKEHALIKENNELRRQVDQLRARLGMPPLPPPAPLLAPVSEKPSMQYRQSFSSADGFGDEMAHSMGSSTSAGAADSNSSPGSQQDQASPTTAPTSPTSTLDVSSPSLPSMFGSPTVESPIDSNDERRQQHLATLNPAQLASAPFAMPHHPNLANMSNLSAQAAQAQALLQAQFGYMSPNLLTSQHTALLALHLQQQQQALHQHHQHNQQQQHQQHQLQEMYGMGGPVGWGVYNGNNNNSNNNSNAAVESYSFLS